MPSESSEQPRATGTFRGKWPWLAAVIPATLLLDLVTKALAAAYLKPLLFEVDPNRRYLTVIDGFFRLKYTENPGAAWGLLRGLPDGLRAPLFVLVSLAAMAFLIWFFWRVEAGKRVLPLALSLLLAGAAGNLVDRMRFGQVVDFIDWYVNFPSPLDLGLFTISAGEKHWPTFNVADAAITLGVVLVLVDMVFLNPRKHREQTKE